MYICVIYIYIHTHIYMRYKSNIIMMIMMATMTTVNATGCAKLQFIYLNIYLDYNRQTNLYKQLQFKLQFIHIFANGIKS